MSALPPPPAGWEGFFALPRVQELLAQISAELATESFYPPRADVFRAFALTPLAALRVVVLGQDPYHNGAATGLAFSVRAGHRTNPSLRNIAAEVRANGYRAPEGHGDLSAWAAQGVFLLNTALTVRPGVANSHAALWKGFTTELIVFLARQRPQPLFLLWGRHAQYFACYLGSAPRLETSHPSPFSARHGFLGSRCFEAANALLCAHEEEFFAEHERDAARRSGPLDWSF